MTILRMRVILSSPLSWDKGTNCDCPILSDGLTSREPFLNQHPTPLSTVPGGQLKRSFKSYTVGVGKIFTRAR